MVKLHSKVVAYSGSALKFTLTPFYILTPCAKLHFMPKWQISWQNIILSLSCIIMNLLFPSKGKR